MKKTDWLPASIKPVHKGVYETRYQGLVNGKIISGFSKWDGEKWSNQGPSFVFNDSAVQHKSWRGVEKE